MAADVLTLAISGSFDKGVRVPKPSEPKPGQPMVALPLSASAKVLLWNEMVGQKVKPAELALRMGSSRPAAQRLTDIGYTSDIDVMPDAMKAVDGRARLVGKTEIAA
jgi:antitoxin HicB